MYSPEAVLSVIQKDFSIFGGVTTVRGGAHARPGHQQGQDQGGDDAPEGEPQKTVLPDEHLDIGFVGFALHDGPPPINRPARGSARAAGGRVRMYMASWGSHQNRKCQRNPVCRIAFSLEIREQTK
jgi:hypothetical protein